MTMVDLRVEAAAEAARLARARAVFRDGDDRALARLEAGGAWIALPRRRRLKRALRGRACLLWRAAFEDGSGHLVESRLVGVLVKIPHGAGRALLDPASRRTGIRSLLEHADGPVRARIEAACDDWALEVERVAGACTSARLAREDDIAGSASASAVASQPGLFDRRVERQHEVRAAKAAECDRTAVERRQAIAAAGAIARMRARLLLVLVP